MPLPFKFVGRVLPALRAGASARGISGRYFSSTPSNLHKEPATTGAKVNVTFITPEGEEKRLVGRVGESLLDLAHANNVDLEGACEASLACSTCHVILDQKFLDLLAEPSDEENDMLDLAFGLTETSRLGCQVELKPELDGIVARIPSATRNVQQEKLNLKGTTACSADLFKKR